MTEPFGVLALIELDRRSYLLAFGVFLIGYGLFKLANPRLVVRAQPVAADFIAGFAGGVTGGAAAFPSAFVTIWSSLKGLSKTQQRAVFQPFIVIMQVAGLAAVGFARRVDGSAAGYDLSALGYAPFGVIGTLAGLWLYRRMSQLQFESALNLMLVVSGASYLI